MTYRDATLSRETRDRLATLELSLVDLDIATYDEKLALREVIERWDANDATEIQDVTE